jgi:hypothetical protein
MVGFRAASRGNLRFTAGLAQPSRVNYGHCDRGWSLVDNWYETPKVPGTQGSPKITWFRRMCLRWRTQTARARHAAFWAAARSSPPSRCLQVLLIALRDAATANGAPYTQATLDRLTTNPGPHRDPDEAHKVWPTNAYRNDLTTIKRAGSTTALAKLFPQHSGTENSRHQDHLSWTPTCTSAEPSHHTTPATRQHRTRHGRRCPSHLLNTQRPRRPVRSRRPRTELDLPLRHAAGRETRRALRNVLEGLQRESRKRHHVLERERTQGRLTRTRPKRAPATTATDEPSATPLTTTTATGATWTPARGLGCC